MGVGFQIRFVLIFRFILFVLYYVFYIGCVLFCERIFLQLCLVGRFTMDFVFIEEVLFYCVYGLDDFSRQLFCVFACFLCILYIYRFLFFYYLGQFLWIYFNLFVFFCMCFIWRQIQRILFIGYYLVIVFVELGGVVIFVVVVFIVFLLVDYRVGVGRGLNYFIGSVCVF